MTSQTPLHLAAGQGRPDVCRQLLEQGAAVDAKDDFDCTPLAAAMLTFALIQARGVNFRSPESEAEAVLGLSQTVAILQQHGADLDLVNKSVHGSFADPVNNWVYDVEAQWRSERLASQLETATAPAQGAYRPQRL